MAAPFYAPAAVGEVSASHPWEARVEVAYFLRFSVSSAGLTLQGRGEDQVRSPTEGAALSHVSYS